MGTKTKGLTMAWIVVEDLDASIAFYTNSLDLQLRVHDEKHGWAELEGPNHTGFGLSSQWKGFQPGGNAIPVFSVEDLQQASQSFPQSQLVGNVVEVPGHVKLQMVRDPNGNHFHLCQRIG